MSISDIKLLLSTPVKSMSKYVKYSHTAETRAKLKLRDNSWSATKVRTPLGVFDSVKAAAEASGLTLYQFGKRIKNKEPGYKYLTPKKVCSDEQRKKMSKATKGREAAWTKKAIRTPLGVFDSVKDAAIAHGYKDGAPLQKRIKRGEPGYAYA